MGHSSSEQNVIACLNALEAVLVGQGTGIDAGKALAAAQATLRD